MVYGACSRHSLECNQSCLEYLYVQSIMIVRAVSMPWHESSINLFTIGDSEHNLSVNILAKLYLNATYLANYLLSA